MSTYQATVRWSRGSDPFAAQQYSRGHAWIFDDGVVVPASASPHVVRAPWSVAAAVDPEEAFVAAISSCHMLFFLSFTAQAGYIVDAYDDPAVGTLARNAAGKEAMTRVVLHPMVTFSGHAPGGAEFAELHHRAHEACYIANSVLTEVQVEPTSSTATG